MKFLENGDKGKSDNSVPLAVKCHHPELGMQLLNRMIKELSEEGMVEQYPKFEGRQIVMVLGPKKK